MSSKNIMALFEGSLAEDDWRRNLTVGDEVYWKDPDHGVSSGIYRIASINAESVTDEDTVLFLVSAAGSEAEVFASELLAEPEVKLTARLLIDVEVVLNGVSKEDFLSDLNRRAEIAIGNGLLTGNTEVEVEHHSASANEVYAADSQEHIENPILGADPATNPLEVTVQVRDGMVETVMVTLAGKDVPHELVVNDLDTIDGEEYEGDPATSGGRNIFEEALGASFIVVNSAPQEDLRIRRDLIAQEILNGYPISTVITKEIYDADTPFGDCLIWMHQGFEFPNWEGRTLGEFLRQYVIPGEPDSLNVIQASSDHFNEDGIKATNITLKELNDAQPLGEQGWLLSSGMEVWFK